MMGLIRAEGTNGPLIRVLCLLLAVLLWLSVLVERPGEVKFEAPLRIERLPAGLSLASPPPAKVEVTVTGPRIALWLLPYRDVSCRVDLAGAAPGVRALKLQEASIHLPEPELKVVNVIPAQVPVDLVKRGL
jgi:YbbR domain-containing protein